MTEAEPVHCPLQRILVTEVEAVRAAGWVTVDDPVMVQPLASVTVTV